MNKRTEIRASLTKKQFVEQVIEYCDLRPWWGVECVNERTAHFFIYTNETPTRYIWFEYDRNNLKVNITTEINGNFDLSYYLPHYSFTAEDIPLLFDQLNLGSCNDIRY